VRSTSRGWRQYVSELEQRVGWLEQRFWLGFSALEPAWWAGAGSSGASIARVTEPSSRSAKPRPRLLRRLRATIVSTASSSFVRPRAGPLDLGELVALRELLLTFVLA